MGVTVKKGITSSPSDVVDDTTPTLGGDLDGGGFDITNVDNTSSESFTADPDGTYAATTGYSFGDGGVRIYEESADTLIFQLAGAKRFRFSTSSITTNSTNGSALVFGNATATLPTLCPVKGDLDTGIGRVAADALSLVSGGMEAVRFAEVSGGVLQSNSAISGITADVGSAQGGSPLVSTVNEISVCANAGDSVTAPACITGLSHLLTIVNNGANACDVFPASGDNLGAGVDTAISLASGANITYRSYDDTNWFTVT